MNSSSSFALYPPHNKHSTFTKFIFQIISINSHFLSMFVINNGVVRYLLREEMRKKSPQGRHICSSMLWPSKQRKKSIVGEISWTCLHLKKACIHNSSFHSPRLISTHINFIMTHTVPSQWDRLELCTVFNQSFCFCQTLNKLHL